MSLMDSISCSVCYGSAYSFSYWSVYGRNYRNIYGFWLYVSIKLYLSFLNCFSKKLVFHELLYGWSFWL